MPEIRSRIDYDIPYPHYRVLVADGCTDLRGVDMSRARLTDVDLTGYLRNPEDPPIPDWRVVAGVLAWVCPACDGDNGHGFEDRAPCGDCCDCCVHLACRRCGDHCGDDDTRYCESCERCGDCCECVHCERCGEECTDTYCGDCSNEHGETRCEGCCRGHASEDDAEEFDPGRPFPAGKHDSFTCKRLVGVEWEHNDPIDASDLHRRWRAGYHSDGSCGWELVTAPLAGDNIAACLSDVADAIADAGANESCGIHVHVDAQDLSWSDMYRLLWTYALVEPMLYILGGQQRVKNTYCRPCGPDYSAALADIDRKGSVLAAAMATRTDAPTKDQARAELRSGFDKKHTGRYKGLNICPWISGRQNALQWDGKKGRYTRKPNRRNDTTVEFRIHCNSLDASRVTGWAQLLARFVDWVAKASDAEAQALPRSPLRALCVIAPDLAPWIMQRVRAWRNATSVAKRNHPYDYLGNRRSPRRITIQNGAYQCAA